MHIVISYKRFLVVLISFKKLLVFNQNLNVVQNFNRILRLNKKMFKILLCTINFTEFNCIKNALKYCLSFFSFVVSADECNLSDLMVFLNFIKDIVKQEKSVTLQVRGGWLFLLICKTR